MNLLERLLAKNRVRQARTALAALRSAANYEALAREHAQLDEWTDVQRVCTEGVTAFPHELELRRLLERARVLELEDRTRELSRQLRDAPRPALWRELVELLLATQRVARAEECAQEWHGCTGDAEALYWRGKARLQRFYADKRRDDARLALDLFDQAEQELPGDVQLIEARLELYTRVGAWAEARDQAKRWLDLLPGDPGIEARFRTLSANAVHAPSLEQALRAVEKSGRLLDEESAQMTSTPSSGSIRPRLKELADEPGVHAAIYVRGATALVQGSKGATAERQARAVREVVQKSCATARRLGLGQALEIRLQGNYGELLIVPGESGAAALWCDAQYDERRRRALWELVGGAKHHTGSSA